MHTATYRSGHLLALAIVVGTGLQLLWYAALAIAGTLALADASFAPWVGFLSVWDAGTWITVVYVLTFALFLRWVYFAVRNLEALGASALWITPKDAVWSFFIPFVNLYKPYQVLSHIWTESQPPQPNEHGYVLKRSASVVTAWWVLLWIANIHERVVRPTADMEEAFAQLLLIALSFGITGVLFIRMVWLSEKRQAAQWQDLQLRAQAPKPTGDALR